MLPPLAPVAFRTVAGALLDVESLAVTLSDDKVQCIAASLAPCADKYGIDLGGVFTGPEAQALVVAGPLLFEAARQLRLELKAKRAKPVQAASDAPAG